MDNSESVIADLLAQFDGMGDKTLGERLQAIYAAGRAAALAELADQGRAGPSDFRIASEGYDVFARHQRRNPDHPVEAALSECFKSIARVIREGEVQPLLARAEEAERVALVANEQGVRYMRELRDAVGLLRRLMDSLGGGLRHICDEEYTLCVSCDKDQGATPTTFAEMHEPNCCWQSCVNYLAAHPEPEAAE